MPPFPTTVSLWSTFLQAADPAAPGRREALDRLCRQYWSPVLGFIRATRRLPDADVHDLAQEFFVELLEGDMLRRYSAEGGKFRSYLCGAIKLFLLESARKASARKRGGGRSFFELQDYDEIPGAASPEEAFDRQWTRTLLRMAVEDLREELEAAGRGTVFAVFDRYELDSPPEGPPSYPALAAELGIKETDVDNHLRFCRRRMRELVAQRVRDTVATPEDARRELDELFR